MAAALALPPDHGPMVVAARSNPNHVLLAGDDLLGCFGPLATALPASIDAGPELSAAVAAAVPEAAHLARGEIASLTTR